jgi:RND superfamily putative drug exporter
MRLKLRLALRLGWRDRGVNLNAVVMEAVGKEHWDRSHDPREAMVGGLAHSGRVIFAAGAVILTFALSGLLPPKEMGIILGISVLLDAMLVRLMLVPILLRLTGRVAWWLPRWLDALRALMGSA